MVCELYLNLKNCMIKKILIPNKYVLTSNMKWYIIALNILNLSNYYVNGNERKKEKKL